MKKVSSKHLPKASLALSYKINDNPTLPQVKNFKLKNVKGLGKKRRGIRLNQKNKTHRTHATLKNNNTA